MTQTDAQTLLSVRGEAQRVVDADQATVQAAIAQTRDSKAAASDEAVALLDTVIGGLTELGGVVLTAANSRAPLTWSAQSLRTFEEYDKSHGGPSGRHTASVTFVVAVRDFSLLGRLEERLTARDGIALQSIQWSVDRDNPEWALVRADAIQAALLKGQDYASALGGSVIGVEHVADAGLLGGGDPGQRFAAARASAATMGVDPASTSLDPVPQVLTATIEARLTATVGPLPTH